MKKWRILQKAYKWIPLKGIQKKKKKFAFKKNDSMKNDEKSNYGKLEKMNINTDKWEILKIKNDWYHLYVWAKVSDRLPSMSLSTLFLWFDWGKNVLNNYLIVIGFAVSKTVMIYEPLQKEMGVKWKFGIPL